MTWSIRDRATFAALRASTARARSGPIGVTRLDAPGPVRVGYVIGRRTGSAVDRNRLRRRLRAIVAEIEPTLGAGAYLISASPAATETSFQDLQAHLVAAVDELQP